MSDSPLGILTFQTMDPLFFQWNFVPPQKHESADYFLAAFIPGDSGVLKSCLAHCTSSTPSRRLTSSLACGMQYTK